MKLNSITIRNYRQFYGEQTLVFSTSKQANVTVIHGENGSGKTALLNAFKWSLYGNTDFEDGTSHLLCERTIAETKQEQIVDVTVELKFEDEDRKYELVRTLDFRVNNSYATPLGRDVLSLTYIDSSGQLRNVDNPQTTINQILPSRMHPYFFFNGERIEKLSTVEGSRDVQNAIKAIMGLEILERASKHLEKGVLKQLRKDLKGSSSDELTSVIDLLTSYEEERDALQENLEQSERNVHSLKTRSDDIEETLKQIGPVAKLQQERQRLTDRTEEIDDERLTIKADRNELISRSGFLAFTGDMLKKCDDFLTLSRKRGELPGNIKQQFIEDLIKQGNCICGRPLAEHPQAVESLESYKSKVVSNDIENAFIEVSSAVRSMRIQRSELPDRIKAFSSRIDNLNLERERAIARLDEISQTIGSSTIKEANELEDKRTQLKRDIETELFEQGKIVQLINDKNIKIDETRDKRKKLEAAGQSEEKASRKLAYAEEAAQIIRALNDSLSNSVRKELSEVVNNTFQRILKKDYWAEISEDYSLKIKKQVGENVQEVIGKSTGESQVSSLAFIGGLLALAKQRSGSSSPFYKGGVFPIVMDSPYGNLDPEYRQRVAQAIPDLANQVIVLVSNSQWKPEVEAAVKHLTGHEYTLIYHTPNKKKGTRTSSIVQSTEFEYTKIEKGYYE